MRTLLAVALCVVLLPLAAAQAAPRAARPQAASPVSRAPAAAEPAVVVQRQDAIQAIPRADLHVTFVKLPVGDSGLFDITLRNDGKVASEATAVGFQAGGPRCAQAGVAPQQWDSLGFMPLKALKVTASDAMAFKMSFTLPPRFAHNGCPVRIVVDPLDKVKESDESNNTYDAANAYRPRPDLQAGRGEAGLTVRNTGDGPSPPSHMELLCHCVFYNPPPSGIPVCTCGDVVERRWEWAVPAIAPGASFAVPSPMNPYLNKVDFTVSADAKNEVVEWSEVNNQVNQHY